MELMICVLNKELMVVREFINSTKRLKAKGTKYSPEWILTSLLLRIRGKPSYILLRRQGILPLPSLTTMRRYLKRVKIECGFDKEFFERFKDIMDNTKRLSRRGILLADEMKVRKTIGVNSSTLTFDGLANTKLDTISANTNEQADYALVFMFSSIHGKFHQPVATFLSTNATKGDVLASLALSAIIYIEQSGGIVDGIVCDGATPNRRMWTIFNVRGTLNSMNCNMPDPLFPCKKIYFFSDAPHLIKCIRNRLHERDLKMDGEWIKWQHFATLYSQDQKNRGGLRYCPNLTLSHIQPSSQMKMRVYLATQIFSRTVAFALKEMSQMLPHLFPDCEKTIWFVKWINNMFDALNRKHTKEGVRKNGSDLKILKEFLIKLNEWEGQVNKGDITSDQFLTKSTAEGLRVTINSTIALCEVLFKEGFMYVLTAKFNQDLLELFFGIVRQAGGCNDHPTSINFLQLYKLLSLYNLIRPPKNGNCSIDASKNSELLFNKMNAENLQLIFKKQTYKSYKQIHVEKLIKYLETDLKLSDDEIENALSQEEFENLFYDLSDEDSNLNSKNNLTEMENRIVFYICGFVCRKLLKEISCDRCKKFFKSSDGSMFLDEASFVHMKNFGGLIYAHRDLFDFFCSVEEHFQSIIESGNNNNVYNDTVEAVIEESKRVNNAKVHKLKRHICVEHLEKTIAQTLHFYVTMRMRQWSEWRNKQTEKESREKRKLAKFCET